MIEIPKIWDLLQYDPAQPLLFSSGLFLFLFTIFIWIYIILSPYERPRLIFVALFSFYFYYKSSGFYFLLLLSASIIDYNLANWLFKAKDHRLKKIFLLLSLTANLGVLGYFKYYNFIADNVGILTGREATHFDIFLPVGISFFTFQSLSYTIDIYRGHLKPVKSFLDYAFYLSFFPQLVAGPIVRASEFIPQIRKPVYVSDEMIGRGVFLIASGLFKKAFISDYISINFVDRVFDNPGLYTGVENLLSVYGYALQIYCDFSGYSDMAIGIALLLGFHFHINFNSPYQSTNITEFWRRWHISLSTWLRDYVYISLGGNRKGKARTYFNLMVTMLLGGLWHGASWLFVIWGGLHGLALCVHKLFHEYTSGQRSYWWKNLMGWIITFHFICFCWIFFRAETMENAQTMINQIAFHLQGEVVWAWITGYPFVFGLMVLGYLLHFVPQRIETRIEMAVTRWPLLVKAGMLAAVVFLVMQTRSSAVQPFIYFQF